MAKIAYQDKDFTMTSGGVYTEYIMESGEDAADLPTDNCRCGSLAYDPATNTLYMLNAASEWGEVGA